MFIYTYLCVYVYTWKYVYISDTPLRAAGTTKNVLSMDAMKIPVRNSGFPKTPVQNQNQTCL